MQASAILGLRAVAPIHAGSDDARGVVDLPIQREKHNNWPVVFASSVKGALREACTRQRATAANGAGDGAIDVAALFGSADQSGQTDQANQTKPGMQAGALLVSDMQLLALPVAALDAAFRWVTCPSALARLARSRARFRIGAPAPAPTQHAPELLAPELLVPDMALHFSDSLPTQKDIFLREYLFKAQRADATIMPWLDLLAELFGPHTARSELIERLLIISDQRFGFLADSATSVAPHIKLNENKTTQDGAMFYEETLPPETLMFLPLACEDERKSEAPQAGAQLLAQLLVQFPNQQGFLRVGGNETTGMGWFEVHVCKGQP